MNKQGIHKDFKLIWQLISPYWRSQEAFLAWGLLIFVVGLNLSIVYLNVQINYWNNDLFNSIQNMNADKFYDLLPLFMIYASFFVACVVLNNYFTGILSFRWRSWLTGEYVHKWLDNHAYYRIMLEREPTDNPDQRISQDLKEFASTTLDLFITVIEQGVTIFSFSIILWTLSGTLTFSLFSLGIVHIDGYMFWAAFIYASLGTYIAHLVGKKLIPLNFEQEKCEADFRYRLVRFREKREEIAFFDNAQFEDRVFHTSFLHIKNNFYRILKQAIYLNGWQNIYINASSIFPILVMSPKFFAGAITLGTLMQISGAFGRVENSLAIFLLKYQTLASWRAVTKRLIGFEQDIANVNLLNHQKNRNIKISYQHEGTKLCVSNLNVQTPNEGIILENVNFEVNKTEKILLKGTSGIGKSTLLRILSGLWPFGGGDVILPKCSRLMIVPQKPYLPLGTLKDVITYSCKGNITDTQIKEALEACRLSHLMGYLQEESDWTNILSLGEQQRINIIRLILCQPEWAIMDEPTASMDVETEKNIFDIINKYCPDLTLITVGHSPTLKGYHDRVIDVTQWSTKL